MKTESQLEKDEKMCRKKSTSKQLCSKGPEPNSPEVGILRLVSPGTPAISLPPNPPSFLAPALCSSLSDPPPSPSSLLAGFLLCCLLVSFSWASCWAFCLSISHSVNLFVNGVPLPPCLSLSLLLGRSLGHRCQMLAGVDRFATMGSARSGVLEDD